MCIWYLDSPLINASGNLTHRYAGTGKPPPQLCSGALAFSVPRLSKFILPEEVVRERGSMAAWLADMCKSQHQAVALRLNMAHISHHAFCFPRSQYQKSRAAVDVDVEVAEEEEVYFSDDELEAAYQVQALFFLACCVNVLPPPSPRRATSAMRLTSLLPTS